MSRKPETTLSVRVNALSPSHRSQSLPTFSAGVQGESAAGAGDSSRPRTWFAATGSSAAAAAGGGAGAGGAWGAGARVCAAGALGLVLGSLAAAAVLLDTHRPAAEPAEDGVCARIRA